MTCPLNSTQVQWLLHDLCVGMGHCLPPSEHDRILANPPNDIDAFTNEVMIAEGLNPEHEKKLRKGVRELVAQHFARAQDAQ